MSGDPYKSGCVYTDPIRGKTECTVNEDCASNLFCHEKSCISPCTNLLCGSNAFCEPENHAGWCRCKVGFIENSKGECVSRKLFFPLFLIKLPNLLTKLLKIKSFNIKLRIFNAIFVLENLMIVIKILICSFHHVHKNYMKIIN